MYITAIHQITDPEKFRQAVRVATPPVSEFPTGIVLHSTFANVNDTKAVCLWQADTVEEVRDLVDSAVGQFSRNEYFEVSKETALGLPTDRQTRTHLSWTGARAVVHSFRPAGSPS